MLPVHCADHLILIAVQAVMAFAEVRRSPGTVASDSSPTNSQGASIVIVASLPSFETTVTFARPF